jgi:ribulose-5-phosphate 4-epimerase/fuculose-1-phosphate aldolase
MTYDEGVIKFAAEHDFRELNTDRYGEVAASLVAWRGILMQTGLVGQDPSRYGGAGYGNVSARVGAPSASQKERSFLVSGTQTGGMECVSLDDFALVRHYDYQSNQVQSQGLIQPSSEAMTHGAIYDLGSQIRFVFHGHCPIIWSQAESLKLPTTDPSIPYGTPEMAKEVQRLYRSSTLSERKVLAMGGHEDGVVVFGKTPEEAGTLFMATLAKAYTYLSAIAGTALCVKGPR